MTTMFPAPPTAEVRINPVTVIGPLSDSTYDFVDGRIAFQVNVVPLSETVDAVVTCTVTPNVFVAAIAWPYQAAPQNTAAMVASAAARFSDLMSYYGAAVADVVTFT